MPFRVRLPQLTVPAATASAANLNISLNIVGLVEAPESAYHLQIRGGSAARWQALNPILLDREIGLESTSKLFKFGDGTTPWNSLKYCTDASLIQNVLATVNGGTGLSSYNTGDLISASASNTLSNLAVGSTGQVLGVSGGVPAWVAPSTLSNIPPQSNTTTGVSLYNDGTNTGTIGTSYTSIPNFVYSEEQLVNGAASTAFWTSGNAITIPAGLGGHYFVSFIVTANGSASGILDMTVAVFQNGVGASPQSIISGQTIGAVAYQVFIAASGIIKCAVGDSITCKVSSYNATQPFSNIWAQLYMIGA